MILNNNEYCFKKIYFCAIAHMEFKWYVTFQVHGDIEHTGQGQCEDNYLKPAFSIALYITSSSFQQVCREAMWWFSTIRPIHMQSNLNKRIIMKTVNIFSNVHKIQLHTLKYWYCIHTYINCTLRNYIDILHVYAKLPHDKYLY